VTDLRRTEAQLKWTILLRWRQAQRDRRYVFACRLRVMAMSYHVPFASRSRADATHLRILRRRSAALSCAPAARRLQRAWRRSYSTRRTAWRCPPRHVGLRTPRAADWWLNAKVGGVIALRRP